MALQTANQFQLVPDIASRFTGGVQTGQNIAGQFQAGQQREQQIQQTEEDQASKRLVTSALNISALPDNKKLEALMQNREQIIARGGNPAETDAGIQLAQSGNFEELNSSLGNIIDIGVRQGIIKPAQAEAQGFTLGAGQKRFSPTGEVIAEVAATPKAPSQTTIEKNLIAAGFEPGTPEFQAEVVKTLQKPATQISIGSEKKFQEKLAEGQAKTVGRITEEADAAIDANQSLSVLESIDVETGALEPAKQGLAAFGAAFGLDTSGLANVSKGESFNAEAKRLVLAVKASQKGPQTDKDEATIRSTVANLGNTTAGNQFIIDSARALNNRRIERKEFYDNFIEDSGGNFKNEAGKTADRAWSEFKRNTPMISANLRTPEGLPVFFYRFEESVRNANPDATRQEIIEFWKQQNKGSK